MQHAPRKDRSADAAVALILCRRSPGDGEMTGRRLSFSPLACSVPQMTRTGPITILTTCALLAAVLVGTLLPQNPMPEGFAGGDKLQHAMAFAALVAPTCLWRPRWLIWVLPLLIAIGAGIEFLQAASGRGSSWGDMLANLAGMSGMTLAAHALRSRQRRSLPA